MHTHGGRRKLGCGWVGQRKVRRSDAEKYTDSSVCHVRRQTHRACAVDALVLTFNLYDGYFGVREHSASSVRLHHIDESQCRGQLIRAW